jgi:hypothetical protein
MFVEPFSSVTRLMDCSPRQLVRYLPHNVLGLVVATPRGSSGNLARIILLEDSDDGAAPLYREFSEAQRHHVLHYQNPEYRFVIQPDAHVEYGSSMLGVTNGALLLFEAEWFMCVAYAASGRIAAYKIAAGELAAMPTETETAAFSSWKITIRNPGYDDKARFDVVNFSCP